MGCCPLCWFLLHFTWVRIFAKCMTWGGFSLESWFYLRGEGVIPSAVTCSCFCSFLAHLSLSQVEVTLLSLWLQLVRPEWLCPDVNMSSKANSQSDQMSQRCKGSWSHFLTSEPFYAHTKPPIIPTQSILTLLVLYRKVKQTNIISLRWLH